MGTACLPRFPEHMEITSFPRRTFGQSVQYMGDNAEQLHGFLDADFIQNVEAMLQDGNGEMKSVSRNLPTCSV